jgi:hypothetical protein
MKAAVVAAVYRFAKAWLKLKATRTALVSTAMTGIGQDVLVRMAIEYRSAGRRLQAATDDLDAALLALLQAKPG